MASMAMASNNNSNPNPNTSSDFPKTLLQVNLLDASLDGTLYESCDSCEYETVSFELTAANLDRIYEFLQEDPTFKLSPIANPPVLTPPVITPLDADPLMPPYDPKTNFLSPRPQFLHYKPKPAVEIDSYLRELEEASLDSEEDTQSEGSKKESEDASLEQVVSLQEQKRPKPQFSLRSKAAIALILLLSVASVCCFCGTYKSSEFGAKMEPATLIVVSEHEAAKSEENQTHGDDALESNLEAAENMYDDDDDEHQLFDHFFPASSKDDASSLSPLMDPLFKCEEMKIQAWENHQIRKAEMEMKKMEVPYNLALGASDSEILLEDQPATSIVSEHLYLLLLLFAGAIVVVGATFRCRSKKEVVSEAKINQRKRKYKTGLEKIDYGPCFGSQTVYELLPKQKELVPVRRSNRIRGQQS